MCGIVGFIVQRGQRGQRDLIKVLSDMAVAIAHRGPDDEGFFETVTRDGEYCVGLGHRRLSIIDLENGHQPLSNEDRSIQIVFNGEIYNFKELRRSLIAKGYRFSTKSDTETIVHAYQEYGEGCVKHLRGMFAFAIWDAVKERLFLARDRFGKKPLFIYDKEDKLLFASEAKSLLLFPGVNKAVNREAVFDYLVYRYVPGPLTLFSGIRKLMPGTWMMWEKGKSKEHRYYTPPDQQPPRSAIVPGDVVDTFLKRLEEAVRIRMVSDVPFGAFLSGGIDSSAIVGLMARQSSLPIQTFSVGFTEQQYNELDYANIIAKEFRCEHHELVISWTHLMDELPALIRFRDAPISEPSDIPIFFLSREARQYVKMVLTGEGSDEVLGGYPKHVFEHYAEIYQIIPELLRHKLIEPLIHALPYRFRRLKTAACSLSLEQMEDRFPRWFGALTKQEVLSLMASPKHCYPERSAVYFDSISGNSALRKILFFDQTSWLPDNLLERGDRMTMAASLEARMPFMDHELAAFVSGLPDRYRVRGLQTKWILRQAMKRLLPKSILERPKVGFRVPVNEWFRGEMRDYLCDHLLGSDSRTQAYYKAEVLQQVVQQHLEGRQNHEKLLWALLNLELWHREYGLAA